MMATLVLLARAPHSGRGKSRLRSELRDHHGDLVEDLVTALVDDTMDWAARYRPLVLAVRGDAASLCRLAPHARLVVQPEGPFGLRVAHAVDAGFGDAAGAVIQIGTDSPTLPDELLAEAAAAVRGPGDAALIPAIDGGWVALAVARPLGGALEAAPVRWSTEHAAGDTIAALRADGRQVTVLEPWYDIDDTHGLARLRADGGAAARAPRTVAALSALDALLGGASA